jgi:hypothetical protein
VRAESFQAHQVFSSSKAGQARARKLDAARRDRRQRNPGTELRSGSPDVIIADQKSQIRYILRCIRMEPLGIFYSQFGICFTLWYTYFTANCYILLAIGMFPTVLVFV